MNGTYIFKFFFLDESIEAIIVETEKIHKVGDIINYAEEKYIVVDCNYDKHEAVLRLSH